MRWLDPANPEAKPIIYNYKEFGTLIRKTIGILQDNEIGPGDRILILAENSPEWALLHIAAQTLKIETAAIFASLGPADIMDIAHRVEPKAVFISTNRQWEKFTSSLKHLKKLKLVITCESDIPIPKSLNHLTFDEISDMSPITMKSFRTFVSAIGAKDPFVIIFTSGTTGRQKGVLLTQRAIVAAVNCGIEFTGVTAQDEQLLFLPFAHIAGLTAFYVTPKTQSGMILCSRREDLPRGFALAPTFTLLVPLVYERICKTIRESIDKKPPPLSNLLRRAWKEATSRGSDGSNGIINRLFAQLAIQLIGKGLARKLGGHIRLLGAGGAPSSPEIVACLRGLGFEYLNLYGMSETCGIIALNRINDPNLRIGGVGRPPKGVDIRIAKDGEILVRGDTLMSGYLEKEDNEGAFTKDGYFRTGDIGWIDDLGYLFITGRKKHILVLSTGKKISPEPIELKLCEALPITGSVLIGDEQAFVSAALFMTQETLDKYKKKVGARGVENLLINKMKEKMKGFSDYEIPKKVFIIKGRSDEYPEIMTPTMKIKREVFERKFSRQIKKIYS